MAIPSLAMIPSGYKDGKVYSVLPSNGDGDFTFSRGSNATRVNKDGLIETVTGDTPRLDYSDGSCPSLLLEPQSTNLITYSEDFTDSSWVKTNCTINSNNAISPDGTQNADKLDFTTSNGEIVRTTTGFVVGQEYTMSFYAKTESGTLDFIYGNMNYSTISGTATNEWQRFVITQTLPVTTRYPKIQTTEIGSLLLWGFQLEQQSYATSYIPTNGASATRLADVCNSAGTSDTFNDSEGVLMAEISALVDGDTDRYIAISDGTSSNRIRMGYTTPSKRFRVIVMSGGTLTADINNANTQLLDSTINSKFAFKYKQNDFAIWINGFEVDTDTLGITPIGLSELAFDNGASGGDFYGNTKQLQYYNSALTDSEIEELTSWESFLEMAAGQNYTIK